MSQPAVGHKRTGACPTFDRPVLQRDGYLLRVPLVGGALTGPQTAAVADIAEALGSGIVELTNRGNLQIRGLRSEVVEPALASLRSVGLGDPAAALVTISPFAGDAEHDLRSQLVGSLELLLADGPLLSPKFVVHVDDAHATTAARRAEVSLSPAASDRWLVRIDRIGALECSPAEAVEATTTVADACRQLAPDARIAELLAAQGRHWLRGELGFDADRWTDPPSSTDAATSTAGIDPARDGRAATEPVPGLHRTPDGTTFLLAGARFGRTDGQALGHLAGFQLDLRVTPWRSFAIAVDPAELERGPGDDPDAGHAAALDGLARLGLIVDPGDAAAGVVSCIGAIGCWQTEVDTLAEAERFVAERTSATSAVSATPPVIASDPSPPAGVVHVSGCDKRCATRGPVGLTLLGRDDGTGFDRVPAA